MAEKMTTLNKVLALVEELSPLDKVRLMEKIATSLEDNLREGSPRKSLYGLWAGVDISEEDIAEARREMWSNFPREV